MKSKRAHSHASLTRSGMPYMIVWALYYAWVEAFTTWWTATPGSVYSEAQRRLLMGLTLVTTAAIVCRYRREWFAKTAHLGAGALVLVAGCGLLFVPEALRLYTLPLQAVLMGLVCLSVLIPFVYILNNTEKLYGMVLGSLAANLYSLIFRAGGRGLLLALLALPLAGAALFRQSDLSAEDLMLPVRGNKRTAYISLYLCCFFALFIKGVGKMMLDAATGTAAHSFLFLGGLLGGGLCLLLFIYVPGSLFTLWNITFSAFMLAAVCCAFSGNLPGLMPFAALLTGLAGNLGMIALYYIMGITCRKYRNPTHLKLVLWFGLIGGGGSAVLDALLPSFGGATAVFFPVAIAALGSAAYFIAFPYLLQTYFADEWVADSEATHTDGRFTAQLAHLGLTTREAQICRLLLDGMTMRQIAATLGISQGTVNTHCASLYRKVGIQSKIELVRKFQDNYHI